MSTLLLYLFAFFSGFAALIYQVAWSRILSMTFGSSTLAVSAVVAGFMGGMGIGAWLYHRLADRFASGVRVYAGLEVGIALSTAMLTLIYVELPQAFAILAAIVPEGTAMLWFRFAAVFLLLLIPAACMGATYPALCRVLLRSRSDVEGRLGWIYGLNTLGAALGALVAGLLLIEWVGSTGAVRVANAINLTIGLACFVLARSLAERALTADVEDETLQSELPIWIIGLVLFGSGFATLGYEIVWFRALHYLLGPGTYTLSAILTIFLLGLGFGSLLYRPALRFGRPEWNLGFGQLGIALFAVLAMLAEHYILIYPDLSGNFALFGAKMLRQSWQWHLVSAACIATALLLPATLWMGVVFPLASRLFLGTMTKLTSRVGLAYLLSNLGSISGAVLAAVWILPSLGTIAGTRFLVFVNIALALLVLARAKSRNIRIVAISATVGIALLSIALPERFEFGPAGTVKGRRFVMEYEEESDMGTVQVISARQQRDKRAMALDGVVISATEAWSDSLFAKQIILAHLPMQIDYSIRRTLNIGVASGSTLAALARYPQLERLDAVEISPAVVRGSRFFADFQVFQDPRVELIVEDAVHFLLSTERTYDLIVNDAKAQLRFGGNAKILSKEIYQYSLDRLSECGLFAQVVSIARSSESLHVIMRTFLSVFPELEVFLVSPKLAMMVGSRCPIGGRPEPSAEDLERAQVSDQIKKHFMRDASELRSLWVSSGAEIDAALDDVRINDWNSLPIEFISYRKSGTSAGDWERGYALVFGARLKDADGGPIFARGPMYKSMLKTNTAMMKMLRGDTPGTAKLIGQVLKENPNHVMAHKVLLAIGGSVVEGQGRGD